MELALPNNYVEIKEDEMMYLDGGNWWDLATDLSTILGVEIKVANLILSSVAITNPWLLPVMACVGVGSAAAFLWRVYERLF